MRQRRTSRRTAVGVWLQCCAIAGTVTACQPSGSDTAFDLYPDKPGAMLSLASPGGQTGRVFPPPPSASMQLRIAASGLEGLDILSLSGCAVQRNIIRRDTSLGRMAKPSQQLLLALEYLRLAPPCIQKLRRVDDALADSLQSAWQQQQAQLPALIFNATLGGDEYRAFWRAAPVPGEFPRVDACDTASALHSFEVAVRRWLGGDYRARDRDIELWLAAVAGGAGHEILRPIAVLEAQLDAVLPPPYRRWMDERNQRFDTLAAAPQRHLEQACATQ